MSAPQNSIHLVFAALSWLVSCSLCAGERIDFTNDIVPILTKNGCNAGACHGAAIGRGGFKLSLYGGDPRADYESIVRAVYGRRVNLDSPDRSLLLLKPTEYVAHGGGEVFSPDSESAAKLTEWIAEGAANTSTRSLLRVEVLPRKHVAAGVGATTQLRTIAFYPDGSKRDVTRWTVFTADDPAAVEIRSAKQTDSQPSTGYEARLLRRGRHIVVARFLNEVVPIELIAPLSDEPLNLADQPRYNFVDELIYETLTTLGTTPSPLADDTTFLRRVYLDLTGRLPSLDDVSEKLGPPKRSSSRLDRADLVDELLSTDEFTEYWTFQLAKLLRIRPIQNDDQGAETYHSWLAEQVRQDRSYQLLARDLLLATGDSHAVGPASFYRTGRGAGEQAEFVSELFMGSRLRCANCHNHPLDRWTQDDYHGLAAIFAKLEQGQIVREKPGGITIHPRTREPAIPKLPGVALEEEVDRRNLSDWLTDEENPYFAKAIVNRLWKQMMGRGLVEPVDDFRSTNPATHPKLLNELARDFVNHGYRIRHTIKVIATSAAYSRSAVPTADNNDDNQFYSHFICRPLPPEVLADAISDVLGAFEQYGDLPLGTRAISLVSPNTPSDTLDVLGRCGREESCEDAAVTSGGLSHKLHLFNGALLNARILANESRLSKMLADDRLPMNMIEEFTEIALSRKLARDEKQFWISQLKKSDDKTALMSDYVWALLSSDEFTTNH
ncbi:MAG: DUF1553 domain-containing protein [Pirellulaceae bacterium]